jgi:hypothetical protein
MSQIAFVFIGTMLAFYCVHLYGRYRVNRNPLALLHALLTFFSVVSLYALSLPFLFTVDRTVLLWSDYVAVAGLTALFVVLAKILWFASLRTKMRFRYVGIPVALIGVATLISDVLWLDVDSINYPAAYINVLSSLWLKSLLFSVVMLPGAFWYGRQAIHAVGTRQRLRLAAIAMLLLVISLSIVSENIISSGKGTLVDGIIRLSAGFVTLVIVLATREKTTKAPQTRR